MKVPVRPRDSGVRFNITPLIDICFNLIVFFALASLSVRKETAKGLSLPEAGQSDAGDTAAPRRLVVTMSADRRVFIAGEEIDREEVEQRLIQRCGKDPGSLEVRVRADKTVPFGDVKPLILACARQGVTRLKFAVQPKGTGGQAASGTQDQDTGGQAASATRQKGTGGQGASDVKRQSTGGQAASGTRQQGTPRTGG